MILINGCLGIGTGWSSNIPCFNPLDITSAIRTWLDFDGKVIESDDEGDCMISMFDPIKPWYMCRELL